MGKEMLQRFEKLKQELERLSKLDTVHVDDKNLEIILSLTTLDHELHSNIILLYSRIKSEAQLANTLRRSVLINIVELLEEEYMSNLKNKNTFLKIFYDILNITNNSLLLKGGALLTVLSIFILILATNEKVIPIVNKILTLLTGGS